MKKWLVSLVTLAVAAALFAAGPSVAQKKNPMEAWKAKFDYSGAKYKFLVSNVSHSAINGVYTGFAIRDELWKRTNGQMYFDYRPFSQLGGEGRSPEPAPDRDHPGHERQFGGLDQPGTAYGSGQSTFSDRYL